jgi:hypothetical protein
MSNTSWYKKSMPMVRDVKPYLKDIYAKVSKINGVTNVYVCGSLSKNLNNPSFRLRDIDIIAINNLHSEDLLSITDYNPSLFNLKSLSLEEEGYDPNAIEFTKDFIGINNIDHWAISEDNFLLHWGAMIEDKDEWDEIKKEAEDNATNITGVDRAKLSKVSSHDIKEWVYTHDKYIKNILSDMPNGWYRSSYNANKILDESYKMEQE